MTSAKKTRDANMELLRILSMLLIIFLHSIDHSGVLEKAADCGIPMYFYVRFTYAMCMVCVNLYVMLSGYYMVCSTFRLHKLVSLWMEAAFYGFILKLLFMVTGVDDFSLLSLVSCFFPIFTGRYWFLTIYVGMYLLSPFLNILIRAMDKKQHTLLNLCLAGLFSVWISIHPNMKGMNTGGGWGLAWFVVLYITAAWFRMYYSPEGRPVKWFAVYLTIPMGIAASQCLLGGGDKMNGIVCDILSNWFRYDSLPAYVMTICMFVGFLNIRVYSDKLSKYIASISRLTFGVYLIHAHANVSPWLWKVLDLPAKMVWPWFPLVQMGCVIGIFVVCVAIDALQKKTIGKWEASEKIVKLSEAISKSIENSITSSL